MTWKESNYPDSEITDWSQATTEEADVYLLARGRTAWAAETSTTKGAALQRAWDYLSGLTDWKDYVFDTELPEDIKNAQIVGAYAEVLSPSILQPTLTAEDYLIKKNIAGVIIKEYSSRDRAVASIKEMKSLLARYRSAYPKNYSRVVQA